ncbi:MULTISPECIES: OprD family outer membrane porin [unclassified Nitratiruptor]|uniref:OprD family outer membrane porin n=1 Tax=unclassified Nitratiruptor TaxID=2624044 RepID=UPI001914E665|nr:MULTISPECIES: OprD family outer membrane porin [unclassified Nitratiruptor]
MKRVVTFSIMCVMAMAQESLREQLGTSDEERHMQGELRAGYIDGDKSAAAIGGHIHFDTPSFNGLQIGAVIYAIAPIQGSNSDFFGSYDGGFAFLGESYIKYSDTTNMLQVGRMSIDTPHADSDDIRMVPNYFEGVHYQKSWDNVNIEAGYVTKMAGWENGGDIKKFVRLNEVFGINKKIDGMFFTGIGYEDENNGAFLWYYHIDQIANVLYGELSHTFIWNKFSLLASLQFDRATDTGDGLIGNLDSKTFGIFLETTYQNISLQLAANKEFGNTPSMSSFGGGAFFTSMEDLTIDAVDAKKARSFVLGASYSYNESIDFGITYGNFRAKEKSQFDTDEIDLYATMQIFGVESEIVYASINDKLPNGEDRDIFRIIIKKSF